MPTTPSMERRLARTGEGAKMPDAMLGPFASGRHPGNGDGNAADSLKECQVWASRHMDIEAV